MTYVATMTTEHFEFQAIADDENLAKKRIAIGFAEHLIQYRNYQAKKQFDHSPASMQRVRDEWCDDMGLDTGLTIEQWTKELDAWYGIRVSRFAKDTDVMRDGTKI